MVPEVLAYAWKFGKNRDGVSFECGARPDT